MDDLQRYRNAIGLYSFQVKKMVEQRDKINLDIERVSDLITANANFLPEGERATALQKLAQIVAGPPGFTDSVRNVLRTNPSYAATATSVRDMLARSGFDLSSYTNPLASIHTILKRLAERGEVTANLNGGEVYYRWKQDVPRRNRAFFGEPPVSEET